MKDLIKTDVYGISCTTDKEMYVDSRYVAKFFDKEHCHVLESIKKLINEGSGLSSEFSQSNFRLSKYKSERGKYYPCYLLTFKGFMLLTMSYTTPKAMQIKEWYINKFEEMEKRVQDLLTLRSEYPAFTKALQNLKSDNPYIYSTENDMVYKIATGLSARQWRKALGLQKGESIRPHLNSEQLEKVTDVQRYDSVLIDLYDDYPVRKSLLLKKFPIDTLE